MGGKERVKAVETSCTFLQTHGRFAVHNGVDSSISSIIHYCAVAAPYISDLNLMERKTEKTSVEYHSEIGTTWMTNVVLL